MDVLLDDVALAWRKPRCRVREQGAHSLGSRSGAARGKLAPEVHARHKQLAVELGFSAMDVPAAHGGLDTRVIDQVAVWEQLGRVTNALSLVFLGAAAVDVRGLHARAARALRAAADARQA